MTEIVPSPAPKMSLWAKALIGIGILAIILCGLWWWMNRPIQPVLLNAQEKALVETKIVAIQKPTEAIQKTDEPKYEKGSREIVLTERELNGLLNDKTTLGKTVCFELATNAIHARVETDLDPEIPIVGGRRLNAKARFLVSDVPGEASFILDDVTIWGISMPNDWLAGLKGKNLLGQVLGAGRTGKVPGVEEFKVEAGRLIIRLKE